LRATHHSFAAWTALRENTVGSVAGENPLIIAKYKATARLLHIIYVILELYITKPTPNDYEADNHSHLNYSTTIYGIPFPFIGQ
jgi:hypothetical protein